MSVGAELSSYVQVLLRRKWVIIVCTLVAVGVALVVTKETTPLYEATATVRVAAAPGTEVNEAWVDSALATRMMNTYVEIATGTSMLEEVASRLGTSVAPIVEADVLPETELITITVWHPEAAAASSAAGILANLMVERSLELYGGEATTARELLEGRVEQAKTDLDAAVSAYEQALSMAAPEVELDMLGRQLSLRQNVYVDLLGRYESERVRETLRRNAISVVDVSPAPARPSKPNVPFNAALGLVGGLTFGVLGAFVLEGVDTRIRSAEEAGVLASLPVLARVPEMPRGLLLWSGDQATAKDRGAPLPAWSQTLLKRLSVSRTPSPLSAVVITSAEPGAGKSTIAIQIGLALAHAGRRVILVDANLRRPTLQLFFGLPDAPGLSAVMSGEKAFGPENPGFEVSPRLRVLTAGVPSNGPVALFTPEAVERMLGALAVEQDCIVLDTPAMLSADESGVLAAAAGAVLLVAAQHRTKGEYLRRAGQQLTEIAAGLVGLVVTRVDSLGPRKY